MARTARPARPARTATTTRTATTATPSRTGTTAAATETATTSAPDPFLAPGRLENEAARSRAGDLFVRHGRTVEGLCRGLLRDRTEAEDAAQQTFLSAYRALLGGTEPREPGAWLAAIARNECLARIRARMREPLPVEELGSEAAGADPLEQALRRADLSAFWAAITELPHQQRDALLLREFGGLSYEELAVALGVTAPAVESLLFRARTRVRGQLREAYASIGSAGWLTAAQDAVARVLSAGGAAKIGSIPVVAKAVTATVGIAVVAGGAAVVGERHSGLLHRSHVPVVAAAPAAAPTPPRVVEAVVRPAARVRSQPALRATPAAVVHHVRRSDAARADETAAHADEQRQDGGGGRGGLVRVRSAQGSDGERRTSQIGEQPAATTEAFRQDGGGDHQSPRSGNEGDSASPSDSGSSQAGSRPSDGHGGDTVKVTAIVTQVTEIVPHADGSSPPPGD